MNFFFIIDLIQSPKATHHKRLLSEIAARERGEGRSKNCILRYVGFILVLSRGTKIIAACSQEFAPQSKTSGEEAA